MTAREVQGTLGELVSFDYATGYADGRRDAATGLVAYLDTTFHGGEYVAGYEAASLGV